MISTNKIFLTWRKGKGARRHIIGTLQRDSEGIGTFQYHEENIDEAFHEGVTLFPGFGQFQKYVGPGLIDVSGQK